MRIDEFQINNLAGRTKLTDDNKLIIGNSLDTNWQLSELKNSSIKGKIISFSGTLKSCSSDDSQFCIHHQGHIDSLRIDKSGLITERDQRYVERVCIIQNDHHQFYFEILLYCASESFFVGTANPTSWYTGDEENKFILSDVSITITAQSPVFRTAYLPCQSKQNPDRSQPDMFRIAVPVHPQKAIWLTQLLLSIDRSSLRSGAPVCDIYLLLTSSEDLKFFGNICAILNLSFPVYSVCIRDGLVLEPDMNTAITHLDAGALGAMAIFKKLFGLYFLAKQDNKNTLTVCIDADCICLRWDQHIFERIRENYCDGRFFGVPVEIGSVYRNINDTAFKRYSGASGSVSAAIPLDIYTWFFDIPIYGSNDLLNFLNDAADRNGGLEAFLTSLEWHAFEHTMFTYYLVQKHGSIESYGEISRLLPENLGPADIQRISRKFKYTPLWINAKSFFDNIDVAKNQLNPYFLSHFDRFGLQ